MGCCLALIEPLLCRTASFRPWGNHYVGFDSVDIAAELAVGHGLDEDLVVLFVIADWSENAVISGASTAQMQGAGTGVGLVKAKWPYHPIPFPLLMDYGDRDATRIRTVAERLPYKQDSSSSETAPQNSFLRRILRKHYRRPLCRS